MAWDNNSQKKINNHVKSESSEGIKTKYFKDAYDRTTYVVSAPTNAAHGATASVIKFAYFTTTVFVSGTIEYTSTWDSSWDIAQDTPA
jgi:hypothetical protein